MGLALYLPRVRSSEVLDGVLVMLFPSFPEMLN
jgi:hypothetical protein